jgi:hypothetical protein
MRRLLRKVLAILDGTPVEHGKKSGGQSLVEFALVAPLLAILLVGLAEIGWLADRYLILLEVSRVGARRGTVLVGTQSVTAWNNQASLFPKTTWEVNDSSPSYAGETYSAFDPSADETIRINYRNCGRLVDVEEDAKFFNLIVCQMLDSLDPLTIKTGIDPDNSENTANPFEIFQEFYPDDIVVSAFALQVINNPDDIDFAARGHAEIPTGTWIHVVGRYPINANECTVASDGVTLLASPPERDPFDYIENTGEDAEEITEVNDTPTIDVFGGQQVKEYQRGFSWTGQHKVVRDDWNTVDVDCIGSQWTMERIESLVNLPNFPLTEDEKEFLPTQGLVLVEIFWQHELLMDAPGYNFIFKMLGPRTTISVWAAFPAPSAEPNIDF